MGKIFEGFEGEDYLQADQGLKEVFVAHPELLEGPVELEQEASPINVTPLKLIERAVLAFNEHRRGYRIAGGLALGALGVATGGALAYHHR